MVASIFKAAWWPIHVAVAWVVTRNRAFVERSNRAGRSLRSIAVALAMDKVRAKPTGRYFKRATKAWSALREEMAVGNVRTSGTPFRRVADLQGHAVTTNEMAREIPALEIASLRLSDDGDDTDCLVPEDWRVAHGSNWKNLRGYRNVYVLRDDVLRAFDADVSNVLGAGSGDEKIERPPGLPRDTEAKETHPRARDEATIHPPEQPQQPRVGTRPTRERASRAIQALYPDGVPDHATVPNAKLCRSVGDWLKEQELPEVSDPTILRAADRRK